MTANTGKRSQTANREIVLSRLISAPRELVFEVWTTQKHVEQWWGPNGFRTTTHEIAVKPGGIWRFIMHGPDGVDYPNKIVFIEVKRPERLIYKHSDDEGLELKISFQTTITFEAQGNKTLVTMRSVFESAADLDRVVKEHGAIEGGKQHLARLDEYLSKLKGASK